MRRWTVLASIVVLLAVGSRANAAIELLVNGGFENNPNFGINGDGSFTRLVDPQLPGWKIEADHSVTIHKNPGIYPTISDKYSVNTDGEGLNGDNANFFQDFATTNGTGYQFSFQWQGWTNSATSTKLDVSILDIGTNLFVFAQTYAFDAALHNESATFTGTGNNFRLRIQETPQSGFNDNQFIVDNFSVTESGTVPEPASMAIWSLGALGCAIAGYRRRKAA